MTLPAHKGDTNPLPVGADPTGYMAAADFNALVDAFAGPFASVDGSIVAPAYSFGSEAAGLYRAGPNDLRIAIGGTDLVRTTATEIDLGSASVLTKTLGAFISTGTLTSVGALKASNLDTVAAGTLAIAGTNATELDLGRAGVPVKVPGTVTGAPSDVRVVAAIYKTASSQSIANATAWVTVDFGTSVLDTDNAVSTGASWHFTVPTGKGGLYQVSGVVGISFPASTAVDLVTAILINGTPLQYGSRIAATTWGAAANWHSEFSAVVSLAAGDTIALGVYQNSTAARVLIGDANGNRVSIIRVSGS